MPDEEYPGQTLVTTDHDVIRQWADERGATPATVPGSEYDDHLGRLRLDFPGYGGENLEPVSWEEWLSTFDKRDLEFVYQEHRKQGSDSNFFRLRQREK
ncbi:hypothetical protein [Qaidamihabitans albus]|uniref:hypothetical protein n=1 Tax=Qaidamihabitans albus TaxID=2795733 RepID=UPI0018F17E11|nr:hypothetical protein [Qaidamihabitans albus]